MDPSPELTERVPPPAFNFPWTEEWLKEPETAKIRDVERDGSIAGTRPRRWAFKSEAMRTLMWPSPEANGPGAGHLEPVATWASMLPSPVFSERESKRPCDAEIAIAGVGVERAIESAPSMRPSPV